MEQKHVLIVDDADFLAKILKAKLAGINLSVEQVSNGEDGLKYLEEHTPDLIFLDLIMPRMSGFNFIEKIAGDPRHAKIPIIVLTNLAQEGDRGKIGERAKKYLVKARISIDDVVAAAKEVLLQP